MINQLLHNKCRILIYSIVIIITAVAACYLYSFIVNNNELYLLFSYIASVTTIVALFIAIFEIIHNISISSSIKQQAENLIYPLKYSIYCNAKKYLENTLRHLSEKKYSIALAEYQVFEDHYSNIKNSVENDSLSPTKTTILSALIEINRKTLSSETVDDKITQKLQKNLIHLKNEIEKLEPKVG